jgi:hypothetical protein
VSTSRLPSQRGTTGMHAAHPAVPAQRSPCCTQTRYILNHACPLHSRNASPYYSESHVAFRAACRKFVDEEIIPNVEAWEKAGEVPLSAFRRAGEVGMLMASCGWPEDIPGLPPRPARFDAFWTLIYFDELSRCASGGVVWGLTGGFGIGLPPIVFFGTPELKQRVARPCLLGEKRIALAVSEPKGGSDVANLKTTAVEDGDFFVVSGLKKWSEMMRSQTRTACQLDASRCVYGPPQLAWLIARLGAPLNCHVLRQSRAACLRTSSRQRSGRVARTRGWRECRSC